jgi:hypothetical protein
MPKPTSYHGAPAKPSLKAVFGFCRARCSILAAIAVMTLATILWLAYKFEAFEMRPPSRVFSLPGEAGVIGIDLSKDAEKSR